MAKALTRGKWTDLKEVLLHVPIKVRNLAWKEAMSLVDQVLAGRNNLSPDVDLESGRFAVECVLCRQTIDVDEDFVRKGISSTYRHHDCFMRSSLGLNDQP
jgi:hypothetical protein